jgi:acyl-coenzyme A thioesterase PaaI-like protein
MFKFIDNKIKTNLQMLLFSFFKVPMIFYCRPKLVDISDNSLEIKIKLNRRTKNHLNSMYFGVLSVGADVTGGFLAMKCIQSSDSKIALIFKDFHADFLKRAEGDVHFICNDGQAIRQLVKTAEKSLERENLLVNIIAKVPSLSDDIVAKFKLTLSLKKK